MPQVVLTWTCPSAANRASSRRRCLLVSRSDPVCRVRRAAYSGHRCRFIRRTAKIVTVDKLVAWRDGSSECTELRPLGRRGVRGTEERDGFLHDTCDSRQMSGPEVQASASALRRLDRSDRLADQLDRNPG